MGRMFCVVSCSSPAAPMDSEIRRITVEVLHLGRPCRCWICEQLKAGCAFGVLGTILSTGDTAESESAAILGCTLFLAKGRGRY